MSMIHTLLFVVFPYLALASFGIGHAMRYLSDPLAWNARSSEILDKKGLAWWAAVFHVGVILTLLGHAGGLLVPQAMYDLVGIDAEAHERIAYWGGLAVGAPALIGLIPLWRRRRNNARIAATTRTNDLVTLGWLILVTGTGLFNVMFGHYDLLYTVAPWLRGILTLRPDPSLMVGVPVTYKIHILAAFGLIGFSPFSRLIHVWSVPLTYIGRSPVLYRRRA